MSSRDRAMKRAAAADRDERALDVARPKSGQSGPCVMRQIGLLANAPQLRRMVPDWRGIAVGEALHFISGTTPNAWTPREIEPVRRAEQHR